MCRVFHRRSTSLTDQYHRPTAFPGPREAPDVTASGLLIRANVVLRETLGVDRCRDLGLPFIVIAR